VNKKQLAHARQSVLRAIEVAKSASALATACGQPRQAIDRWRRTGKVPAHHCIPIENATEGAVTRYELRPDVFGQPQDQAAA